MAVSWHRVLAKALAEDPVVAVAQAVTRHLGRAPTRSEITAARRAAHRYAATGEAQLTVLSSVVAGHTRQVLVLARPTIDLDDAETLRRSVTAQARKAEKPKGQKTKDTASRAERLLSQMFHAARAGRLLPVDEIEPAHAKLLAEDLTEIIAGLAALTADLTHRSGQHDPTTRN